MNTFQIKGLSCGHCAQLLEQQIQQLEHGDTAKLSFNSGRLIADARIPVATLAAILKTEGASIVGSTPSAQYVAAGSALAASKHGGAHARNTTSTQHSHAEDHGHGHSHSHDHSNGYDEGHNHDHDHDHNHDHDHGNSRMLKLLIAAAILYVGAIALDAYTDHISVIALYMIAIAISGYITFIRGLRNLLRLKFNIDTLMTIALTGAVAIGEWKEATLVAILFGLNELLEGIGMNKARRSMAALLDNAPKEATVIADGIETIVPISSLSIGDIVLVKAGGQIPSDGVVIGGRSSVNEAAITGESLPVDKQTDDTVFGGSLNNEGVLRIRIEKAYNDSSLAKILHLVQEAQETKTPAELFINKFAKYYTPFIMVIAALVMIVPPLVLDGSWGASVYQGLAVLIVGCPCALILSSPIAIISGIARNARKGILVKGGAHLEQLGKLDMIAFDKTGTLTKGEPHVEQTVVYDDKLLPIAAAIEQASSHPLAKAIMKHVANHDVAIPEADDIHTVAGSGVIAQIDGNAYRLGNESIISHLELAQETQARLQQLKQQGLTLVLVADDSKLLGMFGIADEIRAESREVVAALHRAGIRRTVMLTGDHQRTADKVAAATGITDCYGGLLPEDKLAHIRQLGATGKVAMIGDGINDSPALAAAHLGIAMGKGTDGAIETADIVLMQDHLGSLPGAIALSRRVNNIIRFNIAISLGLKLLALLLTIPGLLTLWIAILSDMGATILVTLTGLTVLVGSKTADKPSPRSQP